MFIYSKVIVRHSLPLLISVGIVCTICTLLPLLLYSFPDFNDPVIGFETRGTTLAGRFVAWENLIEETRPSKSLAVNPQDIKDQIRMNEDYNRIRNNSRKKKKTRKNKKQKNRLSKILLTELRPNNNYSKEHVHFGYGSNISYEENESTANIKNFKKKQWVALKNLDSSLDDYARFYNNSPFCGSPVLEYAHYVVATSDGSSLLKYENIQSLCNLQKVIIDKGNDNYKKVCERPFESEHLGCCQIWSLPNYIAALRNRTNCFEITNDDVQAVSDLLQSCSTYIEKLHESCELEHCDAPMKCTKHNAVFNILNYLIDINAYPANANSNNIIAYSMVFLPLACGSTSLSFYLDIENINMTYGDVYIDAIDFGLKNALFDLWLLKDTWLIGLGGLFVFICAWSYLKSLFLTIMLFLGILYTLGVSFFIYNFIYRLEFFPFMNLLVSVVVIGIGTDDAFLYMKVWNTVKKQIISVNNDPNNLHYTGSNNYLTHSETIMFDIVMETLKHTVCTILVTTVTTSVAYFVSYISYVPAINCFSVFAGTAVLINFILMTTWMPTAVFILETKIPQNLFYRFNLILLQFGDIINEATKLLTRFITVSVTKLALLWIILLGSIGLGSFLVVFYYPGLQLPDTRYFQLFYKNHMFEKYDLKYKDYFMFERYSKDWLTGSKMPLRWVWGIMPVDNGNNMNPASRGYLEFDTSFNLSDPDSQQWLLNFCNNLKSQRFYQPDVGLLYPNCFIETLKQWMNRPCFNTINNVDYSPCCETSRFPYEPDVFDSCILKAVESLYQTSRLLFVPGVAGPKFFKNVDPPKIAALVVEFESTQSHSMSYTEINKFYLEIENWTQDQLKTAPHGLKGGWFISDFQFYDLQSILASGTTTAILLSTALGFFTLLPSTLSLPISLCAVIVMCFSVTVTIAILVLMGWKLNVLESIAISSSAGLAIDFSLHYSLSYSHAKGSRKSRTVSALSASLGPTAASALTTAFSGIFLLNSNILPYTQVATFFALIMLVSWTYATWLLCSLLFFFGSQDLPKQPKESRLSGITSICSGLHNIESHELKHINSNAININPKSPSNSSAITVMLHSGELDTVNPLNESFESH